MSLNVGKKSLLIYSKYCLLNKLAKYCICTVSALFIFIGDPFDPWHLRKILVSLLTLKMWVFVVFPERCRTNWINCSKLLGIEHQMQPTYLSQRLQPLTSGTYLKMSLHILNNLTLWLLHNFKYLYYWKELF